MKSPDAVGEPPEDTPRIALETARPLSDRVLRSCTVALVAADRGRARPIERVLRSMVSQVDVMTSAAGLRGESGHGLVVIDYESLAPRDRDELFDQFPKERCPPRLVIHSGGTSREELSGLFSKYGLTNLLTRADAETEELFVTVQKILRADIFGLEKYFPWGAESATLTLRDSTKRYEVLAKLADAARDVAVPPRFIDQLRTVADELLMNALYDAPIDADGRRPFASLSRECGVKLESADEVRVTFCCDGRRLGISVRDPFGSLRTETVLDYLTRCFRRGADQIDTKEGGAGLGLYFAFEALSHFVINLAPGRATEMIGLLDVRGTYKDFALRGKSFNMFVHE